MVERFGNICLCPNTQREGKKRVQGEKEKNNMQINLWQNHSKLLSQIQRISVTVI